MSDSKAIITFADYGGEKSAFTIHGEVLTAANFDALDAKQSAILNALFNLTLGVWSGFTSIYWSIDYGPLKSADPLAAREQKWLFTYQDDVTGKQYHSTIPCAYLTTGAQGTLQANSEQANLGSDDWIAFITAFEDMARSQDGNTVTFISAKHVGRNI